jgi:hypothetical protein
VRSLLIVETPTPWGEKFYDGNADGSDWQRVRAVSISHQQARKEAGLPAVGPDGQRWVYGVAPEPGYVPAGTTLAILVTRPQGPFSRYVVREYAVPRGAGELEAMAHEVLEGDDSLAAFDQFRLQRPARRHFLVCTHGQVDVCCAKFGIPAYQQIRASSGAQAWRATHFGGHRFAPTLREFPSGYMWGFTDEAALASLLTKGPAFEQLAPKMRGWSGVPGPVQLLDREGFRRFGWAWCDFPREGEVLVGDSDERRWEVRLSYLSPDGRGELRGTVAVTGEHPAPGCAAKWGSHESATPELSLTEFQVG